MDAPQIDAMIDSTSWFWGRLRRPFVLPCKEIGFAYLKSSIISPHSLINHWYRKSESIPNSYRKVLFYTLA